MKKSPLLEKIQLDLPELRAFREEKSVKRLSYITLLTTIVFLLSTVHLYFENSKLYDILDYKQTLCDKFQENYSAKLAEFNKLELIRTKLEVELDEISQRKCPIVDCPEVPCICPLNVNIVTTSGEEERKVFIEEIAAQEGKISSSIPLSLHSVGLCGNGLTGWQKAALQRDFALVNPGEGKTGSAILYNYTSTTFSPAEDKPLWSLLANIGESLGIDVVGRPEEAVALSLSSKSQEDRTDVADSVVLGRCWAMKSSSGELTIALPQEIQFLGVTIEHVDKTIARNINSAPANFSVFAYKSTEELMTSLTIPSDPQMHLALKGYYDVKAGCISQTYFISDAVCSLDPFNRLGCSHNKRPTRIVRLKIESNYGNKEFTCLYRFKVHGIII